MAVGTRDCPLWTGPWPFLLLIQHGLLLFHLGTLFLAFFTAMASWRVFEMVSKLHTHKKNMAALCILFVPTVSFWCTGISKDTVIFISVLNLLYYAFDVMVLKNRIRFKHIFIVLLSLFLIYQVRSFIIAAIVAPLFMAFGARMTKKYVRPKGTNIDFW